MRALKLNENTAKKILSEVERILRSGGLAVVPTDTVYGIIGDATKPEVIRKLFSIKKRSGEKVFPIFVKDVSEARKIAYVADAKARMLERVWPGPITVVLQHKEKMPKVLTGGKDTIGIRIPDHTFLSELLKRLDFPLVQTSANLAQKPPAKNIEEVKEYFGQSEGKPDLVVDGGEIKGKSSTVIDYTGKEPMILRTGIVTREELDRILESVS